jgi:hypothetical protein
MGATGPPLACVVSDCPLYRTNRVWDHSRSRMGVARALYDSNVPFRFVYEEQVLHGLVAQESNATQTTVVNASAFLAQFPVIFASGTVVMDADVLSNLRDYVVAGGRLVTDAPFALFENYTVDLVSEGTPLGDAVRDLFGCIADDYGDTRSTPAGLSLSFTGFDAQPYFVGALPNDSVAYVTGYACAAANTSSPAGTLLSFADAGDGSGQALPALWEARLGKGSVAVLAFEAGKLNWDINARNAALAQLIVGSALGTLPGATTRARTTSSGWTVSGSGVRALRREVPTPDPLNGVNNAVHHLFLFNSGAAPVQATYTSQTQTYTSAADAVSGQVLPLVGGKQLSVTVPAGDALWVRLVLPSS